MEDKKQNISQKEKEYEAYKKRTKTAIVGSYILIVGLFILFLLFRCQCPMDGSNTMPNDIEKGGIEFVNPEADRNLQDEVNKAVELGMFNVFMNTDIVFENGEAKGNLLIQNVETNKVPVFVEIYIKDTNELIYKSDEIPVGFKIEEAPLNQSLGKGTYECVAYFNLIDDESNEIKNKIGLNVDITIKN